MDEIKDKGIHHSAIRICEELKTMPAFVSIYNEVQVSQLHFSLPERSRALHTFYLLVP